MLSAAESSILRHRLVVLPTAIALLFMTKISWLVAVTEYRFRGARFTVLGVSYQRVHTNYLQAGTAVGGLGGLSSEVVYPEGGEGRITEVP